MEQEYTLCNQKKLKKEIIITKSDQFSIKIREHTIHSTKQSTKGIASYPFQQANLIPHSANIVKIYSLFVTLCEIILILDSIKSPILNRNKAALNCLEVIHNSLAAKIIPTNTPIHTQTHTHILNLI